MKHLKAIDKLFAYDSKHSKVVAEAQKRYRQANRYNDEVLTQEPDIPVMDEAYLRLEHDELISQMQENGLKVAQKRGEIRHFTSKDEKLMNEIAKNAEALERARRRA